MQYPYHTPEAELALLQKISYTCNKAILDYVDSLSVSKEGGVRTFTFKTKEEVAKYQQLQEASLESSKNIHKFYKEHPEQGPEIETAKRLDTIAEKQAQDLREFLEKNKNIKAHIILDINDHKVSCEFELGQVQELAENFNIDLFPMMINQLLVEHVNGSKETITEKSTI